MEGGEFQMAVVMAGFYRKGERQSSPVKCCLVILLEFDSAINLHRPGPKKVSYSKRVSTPLMNLRAVKRCLVILLEFDSAINLHRPGPKKVSYSKHVSTPLMNLRAESARLAKDCLFCDLGLQN